MIFDPRSLTISPLPTAKELVDGAMAPSAQSDSKREEEDVRPPGEFLDSALAISSVSPHPKGIPQSPDIPLLFISSLECMTSENR